MCSRTAFSSPPRPRATKSPPEERGPGAAGRSDRREGPQTSSHHEELGGHARPGSRRPARGPVRQQDPSGPNERSKRQRGREITSSGCRISTARFAGRRADDAASGEEYSELGRPGRLRGLPIAQRTRTRSVARGANCAGTGQIWQMPKTWLPTRRSTDGRATHGRKHWLDVGKFSAA